MQTYPASRCQHLKVNGTQCGSPALRNHRFCFFHRQWRAKRLSINPNATRRPASVTLPVLEDANSIQVAVMQVTRLLLAGQIEHKTASLTLYALQIASSNLARTSFEASRPTKVVVDRDKVAETPLGATPWAAKGEGHEPEDDEEFENEDSESERLPLLERLRLYPCAPEEEDEDRNEDRDGSDDLPPGTIQACRGQSRWVV